MPDFRHVDDQAIDRLGERAAEARAALIAVGIPAFDSENPSTAGGIEQNNIRDDILSENLVYRLLGEISARPGGRDVLADLANRADAAVRFVIADQWRDPDPVTAVQVLANISMDPARSFLAIAAGVRYRQQRELAIV